MPPLAPLAGPHRLPAIECTPDRSLPIGERHGRSLRSAGAGAPGERCEEHGPPSFPMLRQQALHPLLLLPERAVGNREEAAGEFGLALAGARSLLCLLAPAPLLGRLRTFGEHRTASRRPDMHSPWRCLDFAPERFGPLPRRSLLRPRRAGSPFGRGEEPVAALDSSLHMGQRQHRTRLRLARPRLRQPRRPLHYPKPEVDPSMQSSA